MSAHSYRRGRGPFFAQVPFELLDDPRADAFTIATYAALRSFADFGSDEGAAVSDQTAALRAGCSPRSFLDRRKRLHEMGWIDWGSGKEDGAANRYRVHAALEDGGRKRGGGSAGAAEGVRRSCGGGPQELRRGSAGAADNQEPVPRANTESSSPSAHAGGAPLKIERSGFDPLEWAQSVPEGEGFPSRHLALGVQELFWRGRSPPAAAPDGWSMPAELRHLRRVWSALGAAGACRYMLGARRLVDEGEIGSVASGSAFSAALLVDAEGWEGRQLVDRALEAARGLLEGPAQVGGMLASLAEEVAGG